MTAALLPSERPWATRRAAMPPAANRATTAAVSSLLPSSTRMISCGVSPSAAAISGRSSARFSASFRAGTTTATIGSLAGAMRGLKAPGRRRPCTDRPRSSPPDAMLSPVIVSFLATAIPAFAARRRKSGSQPRIDEGDAATGLGEEIGRGSAVDEPDAGADGEDQARLLIAGGNDGSIAAGHVPRERGRDPRRQPQAGDRGHGHAEGEDVDRQRRDGEEPDAGEGPSLPRGQDRRPPRRQCRAPRRQSPAA